jgi:hypothetical protein
VYVSALTPRWIYRSSPNDARVNLVPFRFLSGWLDIEPEHSLVPIRTGFHVDRGFFPAHLPGKFDGFGPQSRRETDLLLWLIASAVGLELPHRLLYKISGKHRCEQYLFAIHLCRNEYQGFFRRQQLDVKLILALFFFFFFLKPIRVTICRGTHVPQSRSRMVSPA